MKNKNTPTYRLPKQRRKVQSYTVGGQDQGKGLLAYLVEVALADRSRTTVKQLLHDRFISRNGVCTTKWDEELQEGDVLALHPAPLPKDLVHKHIEVLWQDEHLVMIHKRAGIPTVRSGEERDQTALEVVSEHLKKFDPTAKVFLLNRIDKDSAGFVLMARTEALQQELSEHWEQYVPRQTFAVAIEEHLATPEGTLYAPQAKEKATKRTKATLGGGVMAGEASYRTLQSYEGGDLLSVTLLRGRNNRLRRQMAELGRPIVGDWRNGSKRKDIGCVLLDSLAFSFVHPVTGLRYDFDQPVDARFRRALKEG